MNMKVLMITPRVDETHSILGFIPTWIRKLAERVDALYVITPYCNEKTQLPENVTVFDLSEVGVNRLGRFIRFVSKFLQLSNAMLRIIPRVDVVFCHMYPNFTLMSAIYAKLFRKPIVTWYTHGYISKRLRIAHFLANKMVTASKESLRIESNKIIITGHGIDTDKFKPAVNRSAKKDKITILSVGRISPIKDYETLIRAADILVNEESMKNLEFVIVGGVPMASQGKYYERLKKMVKELELGNYVKFVGSIPHTEVVGYYQNCDIFVNPSHASALEKVVLEAMLCEKPVITSNIGYYLDVFDEEMKEKCYFKKEDHKDLANKITHILQMDENRRNELCRSMRDIVKKGHSVETLTDKLVDVFKGITKAHNGNPITSKSFGKGRSKFVSKHVRGEKILDIGCAGSNGFMHRNIVDNNRASKVMGLDINLRDLKRLKGISSDLISAEAEYLPFQDDSFDCVYMGEVVEHFWSAEKLLREVSRVLKIDGRICLDSPNVYSLNRILRFVLRGKDSLGDPDHKVFYTPASLSKLLQSIGFEIIEITSDGKIHFGGKERILNFPPFKWLGSHLCLAARKID